nr:signal peptidase I [Sellimonas intestinalis]
MIRDDEHRRRQRGMIQKAVLKDDGNSGEKKQKEDGEVERVKKKSPLVQDLWLLLLKAGILAALAAFLFVFVFGVARCADASMFPAVKDGDLAVYYRADRDYMQGDVVVLETDGETQIRRVVAVEGDTVEVEESGLYINGALQEENNIYEETQRYQEGIDFPVTLGEDEIFVLGDAREHSTDSRIYGPVNVKDTKGTVITLIRRRGI